MPLNFLHPASRLRTLLRLAACAIALGGLLTSAQTRAESVPPIQVGSETGFPPYADVDANGRAIGFSVELFSAVTRVMNIPVEYRVSDWNEAWNGLTRGRLDALPIVARLKEREGLLEYTSVHTIGYDCFFVRKGEARLASFDEARGKRLIVMRSDASHHALAGRGFIGELVFVDSLASALQLLAAGQHDAVIAPLVQGSVILEQLGLKGLEAGPPLREYRREYAFAVKKGDVVLRDKLEQGLLIAKASGEYQQIYDRWLGLYEPSRFPMVYFAWGGGILAAVLLLAGIWIWTLRRSHERLVESQDRLRFALQKSRMGSWDLDLETHTAQHSLEHDLIFGYTTPQPEWNYERFLAHVLPEDRVDVERRFKGATATHGDWEFECRIRRADGEVRWIWAIGGYVRGMHGQPSRLSGIVQDITERKSSAARIEQLMQQTLLVQEEERTRVSKELHDEIGQSLTALKLLLSRVQGNCCEGSARGCLREAVDATADLMLQVRGIAYRLRPSQLDELGLISSLRWHIDKVVRPQGIVAKLSGNLKDERLPPAVELCCFRVAQEALTNVMRHARATECEVTVNRRDEALTLTVRDNGAGFAAQDTADAALATPTLGLTGMRERVLALGGKFQITSAPGQGTVISAEFHLS